MLKSLALLAACACAALNPAAAQVLYDDALNNAVDPGTALAIGGANTRVLAQTFTVENSGALFGVMIPASCVESTLFVVIEDVAPEGTPGSNPITGREVFPSQLRGGGRFSIVTFPLFVVTAGERYTLMLASLGDCQISRSTPGANYAGGRAYYFSAPGLQWIPSSDSGDPDDLPFRIIMLN